MMPRDFNPYFNIIKQFCTLFLDFTCLTKFFASGTHLKQTEKLTQVNIMLFCLCYSLICFVPFQIFCATDVN